MSQPKTGEKTASFETVDQPRESRSPTTLATVEHLKTALAELWLPCLYQTQIRNLRTRAFALSVPPRENKTEIQHTLLGVELKIGKQRVTCPDLATARYLQVFARLGCAAVAVPYDISRISVVADALESAWQRALLLFDEQTNEADARARSRIRAALVKQLRSEIDTIGAGEAVPQFVQNTKQRAR